MNDPKVVAKLLRAIASGTDAQEKKHDIILNAAADLLEIKAETRTVRDPFLGKDVAVSNRLTDRLRGKYASGPIMTNGEPEFGWREFQTPPIQHEAAAEIDRLSALVERLTLQFRQK